jgi:hypothetical protein
MNLREVLCEDVDLIQLAAAFLFGLCQVVRRTCSFSGSRILLCGVIL